MEQMDSRYYIDHKEELKVHSRGKDYMKMEIFNRFSYAHYNKVIAEYASMYGNAALATKLLNVYETLMRRKPDQEISNFDYFAYFLMHDMVHYITLKKYAGVLRVFPEACRKACEIKRTRETREGVENFEIAKIIYSVGIVRFLELGRPEAVKRLQREYGDKPQDAPLLINLLRSKYRAEKARKGKGL